MSNITSIPAPRVPFIDERTGLISREWYRFFLNLFTLTGSGTTDASWTDLQLAPADPTVVVDMDAPGLGSVCPVCYGTIPSDDPALQVLPAYPVPTDDAALVPGTPEQRVQDLIIPSYPEQTPFDVLAPINPVGFTQRVENLSSDVQGLLLAPPVSFPSASVVRGGIRKVTTTQSFGTLGGGFTAITTYDANSVSAVAGVITDLSAGTLKPTVAGDYAITFNILSQFDSSATSRAYAVRVFDVTASAALTNVGLSIAISPDTIYDTSGVFQIATISSSQVNHHFRLEIGDGSTFTNFYVLNTTFIMYSLGPV